MNVIRTAIADRLSWLAMRRQDVTASDVAAVFGCHPYRTPLALWADKTGAASADGDDSSAMRRGRWMETAVIAAVRDHHPEWVIEQPGVYLRDPETRIGATPDAQVINRGIVVQCKTVADRVFASWDGAPPIHYQMQALTEAMLTGASTAVLAVLSVGSFGRLDYHEFEVPRHAAAEARICAGVRQFWDGVAAGEMPKADYAADHGLIAALYGPRDDVPPLDLSADNYAGELARRYLAAKAAVADSEAELKSVRAEIVEKLNGASVAALPGFVITNKMQHRKEHVVKASSFAVLRVSQQQEKDQ